MIKASSRSHFSIPVPQLASPCGIWPSWHGEYRVQAGTPYQTELQLHLWRCDRPRAHRASRTKAAIETVVLYLSSGFLL